MSFEYLWAHGTVLGAQPFPYFAPLTSLGVFLFIVYIITALKQVLDNPDQRVLW